MLPDSSVRRSPPAQSKLGGARPPGALDEPKDESTWRKLAPALLTAAIFATYARCFTVPFLFDDKPAILDSNPTSRHLWPIWPALSPPIANGQTVGGRPLPNLTLAFNYALSGTAPWSYHLFNILVHVCAALALYGLVRVTLARPGCPLTSGVRSSPSRLLPTPALGIALAAALLWAVHPLQTEAVTYVIQRVESLMALAYLFTLYCFARSVDSPRPVRWQVAAVVVCLAGMACKEVMATAPVAVLLYDRTLVSGSFTAALRRHRQLYAGLAATWLLVVWLAISTHGRGGTAGFPLGGNWESHVLTQIYALGHYLRLVVWPYPLVFDWGYFQVHDVGSVVPQAIFLLALAAAIVWAWRKYPVAGFLGTVFFLVLAPSTLVPIPVQTMAEHRMYLPLAAITVAAAWAAWRWLAPLAWAAVAVAAGILAVVTYRRNFDYQSDFAIWRSAALNHPAGSARASFNYANLLAGQGRKADALAELQRAIQIEPRFAAAYDNLGTVLLSMGKPAEALAAYDRSIELDPKLVDPDFHSGLMLEQTGRPQEAEKRLKAALELDPKRTDARLELGNALFREGKYDEAMEQYQAALRTAQISAEAYNNIGTIWFERRNFTAAIDCYRRALALGPDSADTRLNLGNALALTGQFEPAADQYRAALRLYPQDAEARENLSKVEARLRAH